MNQRTYEGAGPITPDEVMRYVDGEMAPDERAKVDEALARSTELQREIAVFQSMKTDIQGLHFHPATHRGSVWDRVNREVNRPVGLGFVGIGTAVWMAYGAWVFATSPASPWEKLGVGAIAIGILILLTTVIWERYRDWQTDPYKDIQR